MKKSFLLILLSISVLNSMEPKYWQIIEEKQLKDAIRHAQLNEQISFKRCIKRLDVHNLIMLKDQLKKLHDKQVADFRAQSNNEKLQLQIKTLLKNVAVITTVVVTSAALSYNPTNNCLKFFGHSLTVYGFAATIALQTISSSLVDEFNQDIQLLNKKWKKRQQFPLLHNETLKTLEARVDEREKIKQDLLKSEERYSN